MHTHSRRAERRTALKCEELEDRAVPATAALAGGALTVTGTAGDDRIRIVLDNGAVRVIDGSAEIGTFDPAAVASIAVNGLGGNDAILIDPLLQQAAALTGGDGTNKLVGGGGDTTLTGGSGADALFGGSGMNTFDSQGGPINKLFKVKLSDAVLPNAGDRILVAVPANGGIGMPQQTITAAEVDILLRRAAAASVTSDAIIAIVDRNGRILGVRVESGVAPEITGDVGNLVFAVDGAVAKARTGAFFGNNEAPLTSRVIQAISQSSFTQRQIESNPNITDPNSTLRGPGFVAAVGIKSHFPANVPNTPQVDLLYIEGTNRDSSSHPGNDRIKGTADDVPLAQRFNIDSNFVMPGQELFAPDSFGVTSGLMPTAQGRGIATLPGGIPIVKNGQVVGGIGVFFPGKTGFATEENSRLSTTSNGNLPDRSEEAEFIAFAAVGGTRAAVGTVPLTPINDLGGVALPTGFGLPAGRVDLVGIQLDIFGSGGPLQGTLNLRAIGVAVGAGMGNPNDGVNLNVSGGMQVRDGLRAADGWLVTPHDGAGITAAEAASIIAKGLEQGNKTRAAIRLPIGTRAKFVYAVADRNGEIVALFREPDATIFSIDVAVAKARNVAYYSDPAQLQPQDQIQGVPAGIAFTNRTFRFAAQPRFPQGIDVALPGPFSVLLDDPGTDRFTGRQIGPRLPASAYQSVAGFDAFNPGTNFRQQGNILNQNGIVFFPGSAPLYRGADGLIGGFGVSGDGVDQDDVTTVAGQSGFGAPLAIRADQILVSTPNGPVRLPYQKFNRNPEG
jgi:uncharacterized protein GlcG (DUF336 family)